MERIASDRHMSVLELFGFEVAEARGTLKKSGVDDNALASAITAKKRADRSLARQTRSGELPSWQSVDSGARLPSTDLCRS
jgi:hypothetical protein